MSRKNLGIILLFVLAQHVRKYLWAWQKFLNGRKTRKKKIAYELNGRATAFNKLEMVS